MKGTTHIAFSIATTTLVSSKVLGIDITPGEFTQIVAIGTFGGLLPDIDHASSKLGSKIPIIPHLLKHRGITHTIYFVALIITPLYLYTGIDLKFLIYLGVAIISHLIGDSLTPAGLRPFKILGMFDYKVRVPIIQNELIENVIEKGLYIVIPFLIT